MNLPNSIESSLIQSLSSSRDLKAKEELPWIFDPNEQAIHQLLRCYLREVYSQDVLFLNELFISLEFPHIEVQLAVAVRKTGSPTHPFEYLGRSFYRKTSHLCSNELAPNDLDLNNWSRLTSPLLAQMIYDEFSQTHETHAESDFLTHIEDSLRVSQILFAQFQKQQTRSSHAAPFIQSEQSLLFGHPYHPSPKSRLGFSEFEIMNYSPEAGAQFQLDYFLVRKEFLFQDSRLPETAEQITRTYCLPHLEIDSRFGIIPTHPWQAKYLLKLPLVQEAIAQGKILYLGPSGRHYSATSSVRTVYSSELPYFFKLSLNVRITNCIRRNALHELQGSLSVSRIVADLEDGLTRKYPSFHILDEPAFITVNLDPSAAEPNPLITDGFGVLLRKTFDSKIPTYLAGSLFGNQSLGRRTLCDIISINRATWFSFYIHQLLEPLFDLFFEEGILFEPHLQNVLIGIQDGKPTHFWIRDFDNARIISGSRSAAKLKVAPPRVIREYTYQPEQAWKRFLYCLIVNHLYEAIIQLSYQNPELEVQLWRILREKLLEIASSSQNPWTKQSINALIHSDSLPAKANLITRFTRTTDSQAKYVNLLNPLKFISRSQN